MSASDSDIRASFFQLHERLPRQAPGSDATTRRLLEYARPLPDRARVLDLGCGPGRASLLLAAAGGEVTAVDLHEPFLAELREAAAAQGLQGSVTTMEADMGALPFEPGSFDLLWAESSAYSIGFSAALERWRPLIAPGGALVVTECEWTTAEPSTEARAFWDPQYPLRDREANKAAVRAAGYRIVHTYLQPESDWAEYYGPLGARADRADPTRPGMSEALEMTRREIAVRSSHAAEYGYTAYVLRPS